MYLPWGTILLAIEGLLFQLLQHLLSKMRLWVVPETPLTQQADKLFLYRVLERCRRAWLY